ncbi:MAG: threonine/serine exporter family protein [Oscillospiraceae bacterium]|nr:threonine/serine exporter family protein [Oscillospiraceae bacterium]
MIFEMIAAFAAALAFAVIFDVSRSELIFCGLAGLAAEGIYQTAMLIGDRSGAVLISAAAVTAVSRIFANLRKTPVTVYLIAGIIPLVPGAGMYHTVFNIIASDYVKAMSVGIDTIKAASAIAIGIVLVFALPNRLFFKKIKK